MEILFWAVAVVIFIAVETATVQLVSVWLAVGAFIAMLSAFFFGELGFAGQLAIFIVTSAVLVGITFPYVRKRRKKEHIPTNSELDKGKKAVVIEEINSANGTGRVTLNGVDWKAVSDSIISADSIVTVVSVEGAKLIVKQEVNL